MKTTTNTGDTVMAAQEAVRAAPVDTAKAEGWTWQKLSREMAKLGDRQAKQR